MPEKSEGNSPESAACFTCGKAQADPTHDEDWNTREERGRAEERRLEDWAKGRGRLGGKSIREDARGSEHVVELGDGHRVLKQTRVETHSGFGIHLNNTGQGATAGEYLDRLATQNRIFEDDVKIERILKTSPRLSIVTSQPYIVGRAATPEEIEALMESKGFERIGDGIFYNPDEQLLVHDMHPRNAVFSEGVAVPIDPAIQRATPEFAEFIKSNPHRFGG